MSRAQTAATAPPAAQQAGRCLFSAPFDFLGEVAAAYQALMPTTFKEIWRRDELAPDHGLTAWVMNPGQRFVIDEGVLSLYPALAVLVTPSTGRDHIDVTGCERRGISVYSLLDERPTLSRIAASAEFTFLLLLNTLRRLDLGAAEVSAGRWREREDLLRGHELSGRQVGLVGFGRIGQRVARYCVAFGATAAYYDPYVPAAGFPAWTLEKVFERSDLVCVCCRLTPETTGMITAALLRRLKPGASLVNTSRGEVIHERELAEVLTERPDLRVGLDVLSGEVTGTQMRSPLLPLHRSGRIVVTPHIAGATVESQRMAARGALDLLRRHVTMGARLGTRA